MDRYDLVYCADLGIGMSINEIDRSDVTYTIGSLSKVVVSPLSCEIHVGVFSGDFPRFVIRYRMICY